MNETMSVSEHLGMYEREVQKLRGLLLTVHSHVGEGMDECPCSLPSWLVRDIEKALGNE